MVQIAKLSKTKHDWHQLSSLITEWICWKFHDNGEPSDLNERAYKLKLWRKKIYTVGVCYLTDIMPS